MDVVISKINRIVVFIHPGQLKSGCIFLVTLADCHDSFKDELKSWEDSKAIKVYDGPPNSGKSDWQGNVPKADPATAFGRGGGVCGVPDGKMHTS